MVNAGNLAIPRFDFLMESGYLITLCAHFHIEAGDLAITGGYFLMKAGNLCCRIVLHKVAIA